MLVHGLVLLHKCNVSMAEIFEVTICILVAIVGILLMGWRILVIVGIASMCSGLLLHHLKLSCFDAGVMAERLLMICSLNCFLKFHSVY